MIIFLFLPIALFILVIGLSFPLVNDEIPFYKIIIDFPYAYFHPEHIGALIRTLPFPGYFFMQSLIGKLFGFEIWKLRMFNVFCGSLAIVVFFKLLLRLEWLAIKRESALVVSCLLLFSPYFFMSSYLIYTDMPALLLALVATYAYIRKRWFWVASFSLCALIFRQSYLFLIVAFLCDSVYSTRGRSKGSLIGLGLMLSLAIVLCVSAAIFPKALLFHRYIPLQFDQYTLIRQLSLFNVLLVCIGIYTLPLLCLAGKDVIRLRNVAIAVCLSPLFLLKPFYVSFSLFGGGVGFNTVKAFTQATGIPSLIILIPFWMLGIMIVAAIVQEAIRSRTLTLFHFQFFCFLAAVLCSSFFNERYFLAVLPSLFIVLINNNRMPQKRLFPIFLIGILVVLTIVGFYVYVLGRGSLLYR
ncbi:MAG: glycosyltransferase family 39 protein [Candidatus Omnitrophica bacterium]|nr:glycosyltransferase family 39 protein [Candidatus Omnitrophota bacterium]